MVELIMSIGVNRLERLHMGTDRFEIARQTKMDSQASGLDARLYSIIQLSVPISRYL